ncbi:ABC transporter permease [Paenibacillus protaetiae]|uniref:ABC transporter permease n=1 Tax=Paenibacillus protaetiae TaxID=2509456 RepID=A0A4P6FC64_9BACL|nr:ABC transporter permease [Paenibacillus protaetiae]QAY68148.1 ABC transporter permease [Paenibacillus protaetiae]
MLNFFELVMNENMKTYRRPRAWIMSGILALLVIVITVMAYNVTNSPPNGWYMIGIETQVLMMLVTIFSVIIAAGSVADEFATGTIKLLLIRPWSRSKILLSKYISVLMFGVLQVIVLFISTLAVNALVLGLHSTTVQEAFGSDSGSSPFAYLVQFFALKLVTLFVTLTIAFMISTIFRSSALAIGLSIFLILLMNSFAPLLATLKYKWVDYILFIHLDLTQYLDGTPLREGMGYGFSLAVLAVYYIIFVALTWLIFTKRDVAS